MPLAGPSQQCIGLAIPAKSCSTTNQNAIVVLRRTTAVIDSPLGSLRPVPSFRERPAASQASNERRKSAHQNIRLRELMALGEEVTVARLRLAIAAAELRFLQERWRARFRRCETACANGIDDIRARCERNDDVDTLPTNALVARIARAAMVAWRARRQRRRQWKQCRTTTKARHAAVSLASAAPCCFCFCCFWCCCCNDCSC